MCRLDKVRWTKSLIPNRNSWNRCRHRGVSYLITQVPSGNGGFREYMSKFRRSVSDLCADCGTVPLMECLRWIAERMKMNILKGVRVE